LGAARLFFDAAETRHCLARIKEGKTNPVDWPEQAAARQRSLLPLTLALSP